MAENLIINGENKRELYETLLHQLQSLTAGETDVVANMANVAAALKQTFDFFWVGFYVVKEEIVRDGKVVAVLDIDSDKLNEFDKTDAEYLERLCAILPF